MKRLLSLVLAVVLSVSVCFPTWAADRPQTPSAYSVSSLSEYEALLQSVSAQKKSTVSHLDKFLRGVRRLMRFLLGESLMPDKTLPVDVDAEIADLCNFICAECDLDIVKILTNLPECNTLAELTVKVFGIDTAAMREEMLDKCNKLWGQGKFAESSACQLIAVYFSIIQKCDIATQQTEDPDVFQVYLRLTFKDGGDLTLYPGIFINRVTGQAYNVNDAGLVGTGFNCDIYDLLVYATVNSWMRQYGFCLFYDCFCYASPDWMWNYVTRRFKFDYDGREWMIQIWKGNYLITNGGEIGIYNREREKSGSYYNCAAEADMLEMSMTILHGETQLLSLGPAKHWWINGFKMSRTQYKPDTLIMDAAITLKDDAMCAAFCKAIDDNYRHDVHYTVDGLTVHLVW